MLFAAYCLDKPGFLNVRMENRPAHLAYAKANTALVYGGPMFSDDGETPLGSLLVMEAKNRAEIDAIMAKDPYIKAGLFESITVRVFKHTLPLA